MKRVLVLEDLYSIGNRGGCVSSSIFSSFSLESVFVPLSLYTKEGTKALSSSSIFFDNYIKSFKEDMIHFDCIYYSTSSFENNEQIIPFISSFLENDTRFILKSFDSSFFENNKDSTLTPNILITSSISKYKLLEEDMRGEKALDYIIYLNVYISDEKRAIALYDKEIDSIDYFYYKNMNINEKVVKELLASTISSFYINGEKIKDAIRESIKMIGEKCDKLSNDPFLPPYFC